MNPDELTSEELKQMKADAKELLSTLKEIKATLEELNPDDLDELEQKASSIQGSLCLIKDLSDELPDEDRLEELDKRVTSIANQMREISEHELPE